MITRAPGVHMVEIFEETISFAIGAVKLGGREKDVEDCRGQGSTVIFAAFMSIVRRRGFRFLECLDISDKLKGIFMLCCARTFEY